MANFEFDYPVVYFDWQEERFTEGVLAFRAGLPNHLENLLNKDDDLCMLLEAWIVGYSSAEEDHDDNVVCFHLGISKPESSAKELFQMALMHTKNLQRRRSQLNDLFSTSTIFNN